MWFREGPDTMSRSEAEARELLDYRSKEIDRLKRDLQATQARAALTRTLLRRAVEDPTSQQDDWTTEAGAFLKRTGG